MSDASNKRDRSPDDEDSPAAAREAKRAAKSPETAAGGTKEHKEVPAEPPRPYPYFFYTDHSREADPDSLTPVTQRDRTPCFPMKMHAILSNPKLANIIAWDDHGRSFRILRKKEFETQVMPKYFEHTKFGEFGLSLMFEICCLSIVIVLNLHSDCCVHLYLAGSFTRQVNGWGFR